MNAPISSRFKAFRAITTAAILALPLTAHAQNTPGAPYQQQDQQQDPPDRIARLSFLQGEVSLQPASPSADAPFAQAEVNFTLTAGDRLYTAQGALAELETDNLALRLGQLADLTLQSFSQSFVQLGLAQGSLRVRSYALQPNSGLEIDTPNAAFNILRPGDIRLDTYPAEQGRPDTTILTVNAGQVQVTANGLNTTVESSQTLRLDGASPVQAQLVEPLPADGLDQFDQQRDAQRAEAAQAIRDQYVNPAMVGYDDLNAYGDWSPSPDYGQVWYPRNVEAGWTPYHNGHWAYISPWGYTWVEAEPWGFAPFHYGRWNNFDGRWGWVPGPAVVRPVYSPALVAFVGGPGLSIGIGGRGVTAWFALGPREPFVPWYRASPGYVNRVNVSNIYNRNTTEVRNIYVNRTTNVYVDNQANVYVNRNTGTVAVPQQAFAAGRPVRETQVRIDPRQLQQAQVSSRPPEAASRPQPTQGLPPARAVPPNPGRPQLARSPQPSQRLQPQSDPQLTRPQQNQFPARPQPTNQLQTGPQTPPPQSPTQPPAQRPAQTPAQSPVQTPIQSRPRPRPQPQSIPAQPTYVHPPGAMRPANPTTPDPAPQRSNPPAQPGRTPSGADINQSVGAGRNTRPAEPVSPRPQVPPQPQPQSQTRTQPQTTPTPRPQNQRPAEQPTPQPRPAAPPTRSTTPPANHQPKPEDHKPKPPDPK